MGRPVPLADALLRSRHRVRSAGRLEQDLAGGVLGEEPGADGSVEYRPQRRPDTV